jgi:hypothetical protein
LRKLVRLFVDYAESEVYFVGLFKVGVHGHDMRESFLGMLEGPMAIVQNTDTIPQSGLLQASHDVSERTDTEIWKRDRASEPLG